ncbi:thiolase C-terminal domain-containing protein [Xanthobacter pseudotagetidis]|uniref:thiolase C-terminal domain-containing protein n=1 Tax=Xanthobacter pseudotagetidis TaxID=3119911 RepID=UPI003726AA12
MAAATLADAGLGFDDLDGIVVAANDQLDGRAIAIMAASGSVGGVDRDILATPSAGEHAFVLGALRIRSGLFRTQLVMAWSPIEATSVRDALRLGTDPCYERALPLDPLTADALQAGRLEARHPLARQAALAVADKNRAHGRAAGILRDDNAADGQMLRWPIRAGMTAAPGVGVVGLLLTDSAFAGSSAPCALLKGLGWGAEASLLGDRDLARVPSLETAARQAFAHAGMSPASCDLGEITDGTPHQELIAYGALGLAEPDAWAAALGAGEFSQRGRLPINLSGGLAAHNPIFCAGLTRIAEAANQVRGRAGSHQVAGARTAFAAAASGPAMQYNTVAVFARPAEGRA